MLYLREWKAKLKKCLDCNKKLVNRYAERCKSCAAKIRVITIEQRKSMSRSKLGKKNPNYKHGETSNTFCTDCGKKITLDAERCKSCDGIYRFKYNKSYINKLAISRRLKPNKKEIQLFDLINCLFPGCYKFVGNFKFWIDTFNPDFIDKKNKKIIELYGDYWHNLPGYKLRDKRKIKSYKRNNYKTLVIWEHELKNDKKLINKLVGFQYG